jgi:hypothetical protein
MRVAYGAGTHAPCRQCSQDILITEAEMTVRDGKRLVELKCSQRVRLRMEVKPATFNSYRDLGYEQPLRQL